MVKNLKKKTLEFLKQKQQNDGEIIEIETYEDIFLTINSFSENKLYDEAKKSLNYIIKKQTRKGNFEFNDFLKDSNKLSSIYFLKCIDIFFQNFKEKNQIKYYLKSIRRAIEFLEKNFDEDYLLLFDLNLKSEKMFFCKQNAIFLSFADSLAEILNEFDYNKDADKIFLLKSKIELGFIRYFFYEKENILIKSFIPKIKDIEILKSDELIEVLNIYNFDIKFYNKIIIDFEKEVKNETNVKKILYTLINMKKQKNKDFKKYFDKYKKYFIDYPKIIINTSKIIDIENIKKSLFSEYKTNNIDIKKDKITLINPKSIEIANLILKLENEK